MRLIQLQQGQQKTPKRDRGASGADYGILSGYHVDDQFRFLQDALGIQGASVLVSNACAAGAGSAGEVFPYGRFECDSSMAYRSVVAFGHMRIVEDRARKELFFDAFMAKYSDPDLSRPRTDPQV